MYPVKQETLTYSHEEALAWVRAHINGFVREIHISRESSGRYHVVLETEVLS